MFDDLYEKAVAFLREIEEDDHVLVVQHWDMDGSASAAILCRILQAVRGESADRILVPAERKHHPGKETVAYLENHDVDHVIVTDISLPEEVAETILEHCERVLHIDHHGFDDVHEDVVFVNPRSVDDGAYVPCARITYDIAKRFDLNPAWIAGLGIIQDFAVEQNIELFKILREHYPDLLPEDVSQEAVFDAPYGEISSVLNIKPYRNEQEMAEEVNEILLDAADIKEVMGTELYQELQELHVELEAEKDAVMEDFTEEKEVFEEKDLVLYEFSSRFRINSAIATSVSIQDPERVHLIIEKNDVCNVSARCQSGNVDLGTLLQKAVPEEAFAKGADAGGHKQAAGASFPPRYYDAFLENVKALL